MNYIYNKPQPDLVSGDGLAVTGDLGVYTAGADYESRLNIANSSGLVIVQVIESTLPAGANVYVDQDNKQVVVSWPGSATGEEGTVHAADLPQDGKFIAGLDGWNADQGWAYDASATLHASFAGEQGVRLIKSGTYPCDPGQTITATLDVQQGASASYHVSAEVAMYFLDSGFKLIQQAGGNGIVNSSPEIQQSKVTGTAPAGTMYVQFVIGGNRYSEDKPLWVGNAAWDHEYTIHAGTHCLTIQVKDSAGSTAGWSGCAIQFVAKDFVGFTELGALPTVWSTSSAYAECDYDYDPINHCWCAVRSGDPTVYRSDDGCATWTVVGALNTQSSTELGDSPLCAYDPVNKNFMVCSGADALSSDGNFFTYNAATNVLTQGALWTVNPSGYTVCRAFPISTGSMIGNTGVGSAQWKIANATSASTGLTSPGTAYSAAPIAQCDCLSTKEIYTGQFIISSTKSKIAYRGYDDSSWTDLPLETTGSLCIGIDYDPVNDIILAIVLSGSGTTTLYCHAINPHTKEVTTTILPYTYWEGLPGSGSNLWYGEGESGRVFWQADSRKFYYLTGEHGSYTCLFETADFGVTWSCAFSKNGSVAPYIGGYDTGLITKARGSDNMRVFTNDGNPAAVGAHPAGSTIFYRATWE